MPLLPLMVLAEDPNDIPNNLMPYIAQLAVGKLPQISVFGQDYATPDGTGVRDYIHVVDLACGHVKALAALCRSDRLQEVLTVNLGTGCSYSVLEMIKAFEQASGCSVPYQVVDRRPGDVAQCYADPSHALKTLGWRAEYDISRMCADAWRWQSANPNEYRSTP